MTENEMSLKESLTEVYDLNGYNHDKPITNARKDEIISALMGYDTPREKASDGTVTGSVYAIAVIILITIGVLVYKKIKERRANREQ